MSDQKSKRPTSVKRGLLGKLMSVISTDNSSRRNDDLEGAIKIFPYFVERAEREADLRERLRVYAEISKQLSRELVIDHAACYACVIRLVNDDDREVLATIPKDNLTIKKSDLDTVEHALQSIQVSYRQVARSKVETNIEMLILRNGQPVRQKLSWETLWDHVSQDVREAILRNQSPVFILYHKGG